MPPASLGGLGPRVAGYVMRSTGLTNLPVAKTPHYTLTTLYGKTLRVLDKMPKDSVYRLSAEKIVKERLDAVNKYKDLVQLEQSINAGLVEEVILQAEFELQLARNMLEYKPWEELVNKPPANQWQWPFRSIGSSMSS
ncbi:NADH dehydrogenase [ubiquinone] 1 alpha subcomplex subunit 5-like [Paramacrobiotus metropolitanus]|uniref:NADH dehydrogenase [ubiquinone] 1 alpha subcomplex subunit 5-like n=1 Tax=Paramacrobiotus metropolitanus TaxID=2943436 RepID=UPI0024462E8D|nr:NADH dehydrogenase [ubiquinone] 1 alpha subcomplex subunit 5-like [Paramacrobiotus metropolitanus]